jgi:hypothetical protein
MVDDERGHWLWLTRGVCRLVSRVCLIAVGIGIYQTLTTDDGSWLAVGLLLLLGAVAGILGGMLDVDAVRATRRRR